MRILMIVDMQEYFMHHLANRKLRDKINDLIANDEYDKYVFTRFVNAPNSLYEAGLKWSEMQDEESCKIVVNVPPDSIIIDKSTYGLSTEDIDKLKSINVKSIDICGLYTDACVYAISLQLWDRGIFPNIFINYTTAASISAKQIRDVLEHQFASVDDKE